MTLQPLMTAPLAVQVHVAAVLIAMGAGAWLIYFSRKGGKGHRALGVSFLGLIVVACLASMFIHRSAHPIAYGFSFTHVLALFVLGMVWLSITSIRRGNIKLHSFCVRGLFMGALMVNLVINILFVHGVIRDVIFPADPAATHGALRT